ncbi:recombinase RecA, partial [Escherichia coli]
GVDPERVIHTPIQSVEQLKIDMVNQLEAIERGEKVIVFIDSIGNMASKKETEDALNEKSVADMTRAKSLKSLFRIVTPSFSIKNIPCVAVNHTIETIEMFSKTVMTGGTGVMYSADT